MFEMLNMFKKNSYFELDVLSRIKNNKSFISQDVKKNRLKTQCRDETLKTVKTQKDFF